MGRKPPSDPRSGKTPAPSTRGSQISKGTRKSAANGSGIPEGLHNALAAGAAHGDHPSSSSTQAPDDAACMTDKAALVKRIEGIMKLMSKRTFTHCLPCGQPIAGKQPQDWGSSKQTRDGLIPEGPGCVQCLGTYTTGNMCMQPTTPNFIVYCYSCEIDAGAKDAHTKAHRIRLQENGVVKDFFPA